MIIAQRPLMAVYIRYSEELLTYLNPVKLIQTVPREEKYVIYQ